MTKEQVVSEIVAGRPVIVSTGRHVAVADGWDGKYVLVNWGVRGEVRTYVLEYPIESVRIW